MESDYEQQLTATQKKRLDQIIITQQRYNDWGHSLRDMGIRQATGEYIVHLNADSFLYPDALQSILDTSRVEYKPMIENGINRNSPDIIIYPIIMRGMTYHYDQYVRYRSKAGEIGMVYTGIPPRKNNIDCMQLVMKRTLWLEQGGWYLKSAESDGVMYSEFVKKYGMRVVDHVLGEHW